MDEIIDELGDLSLEQKPIRPKARKTAYVCFMQQMISDMKSKGESVKFSELSKKCSLKWKELSDKEKEKYQKKSKEDIVRYEKEMVSYEQHKTKYDRAVELCSEKGYFKHLDDKRHLKDLEDAKNDVKAKPVNKKNVPKNSRSKKAMDDSLEELNGKPMAQQSAQPKPTKSKRLPQKTKYVCEDEEEEDDNEEEKEDLKPKAGGNEEEEGDDDGNDSEQSDEDSDEDSNDESEEESVEEKSEEEEEEVVPKMKKPGKRLF